jgi:hypothetical protein
MGFVERVGDLDRVGQHLSDGQRPLREARGERFALEQLHDEEVDPLVMPHVVDGTDVGMGQGGNGPGLAFEAAAALRAP